VATKSSLGNTPDEKNKNKNWEILVV